MSNRAGKWAAWIAPVGLVMLIASANAAADDAAAGSGSAAPEPAPATDASDSAVPLPTIPPPQPTSLPAPAPDTISELDTLLQKLAAVEPPVREGAMGALANLDSTMLPAIASKLAALRKSADRDAMEVILGEARKAARRDKRGDSEEDDARTAKSNPASSTLAAEEQTLVDPERTDWLQYVLQAPMADKQGYKDLVALLGITRACACIGTTEAARQLVNVYMYFGDMFRIDVQRQLARMKDRALPALIEAQYHDSQMVRTWAKRRLDMLGRAIPSEAVRINDNQALADVLRAYGHAREVEATRVIVSFANSDRLQVREAAREAIGQIGEPARWQLRDAYEDLMGDKPPRTWDWRRTARELFAVYDRARLQEVYTMMDRGVAQLRDNKLEEAVASFDQVLARAPMFERRAEMVPAYLAFAKDRRTSDRPAAMSALRKALTIAPDGDHVAPVKSELALLEAQELAAAGVVDVTLLEHALQLDPSNEAARTMLREAKQDVEVREASWRRFAGATAIGVVALAAMLFIALVPRRRRPAPPRDPEEPAPPAPPATPDAAPPS